MEKDQLDSLATIAVGSEKMPVPHSHYASSEVYSASESPPPAYTRPPMKSSAVQIARIIATTMIAISVIIGSFILASAWLQARASCTPESIAAMQAQLRYHHSQNEFIKHLQPQALIQDREVARDNLQSLSDSSSTEKDEVQADTKDIKVQNDQESKTDNDVDSQTDSDDDDEDYDDGAFPPVHIKLPLQLDLDDLAGTLLQQARSLVSCVVERRRSDEMMDGANDNALTGNNTDRQRVQRLRGERVTILCESGDQRPEQPEQDMLTPIIVPLGTVQVPIQSHDNGYNRYQIHNQYQVPETQRVPMPIDARGMNSPFPIGLLPPELRNLPGVAAEMAPLSRMAHQQNMIRPQPIEMRQIPIELRHILMDPMRGMKPSADQEQHQQQHQHQHQHEQQQQQQQQPIPMVFIHPERPSAMNRQAPGMIPSPLPHQPNQDNVHQQIHEQQNVAPSMMIPRRDGEQTQHPSETQEVPDKPSFPFHGIPMEFRKIIERVPMEITDIIQQFAGVRPAQSPVPEGARREQVQEFKPFPESRAIPFDAFPLPIGVRNLLEHGNIEGRVRQSAQDSEEQREQVKPFAGSENQGEETGRKFGVPADVMNLLNQFVDGPAFPVPRFAMPLRPMDSMEVPVEARAQVSDNQTPAEQTQHDDEEPIMPQQQHQQEQQQQQQEHHQDHAQMMEDHEEMQDESNRHHIVQPRSVRSVPEPFAHPREKRVRRCACNCAC